MGISDMIAGFINEMLEEADGIAELQRSGLANRFNCVPSQINYVISTRFSPERGYIVESRRGGNGYIRITRVRADAKQLMMHIINAVGMEIDAKTAAAFIFNAVEAGVLEKKIAKVILAAMGDSALKGVEVEMRNAIRASILKQVLLNAM